MVISNLHAVADMREMSAWLSIVVAHIGLGKANM